MLNSPNRVICGDNLPILESLPSAAAQMIYIDPPFATGTVRRGRSGSAYDDRQTCPKAFVAWLTPRLVHSHRCLRPEGSLFVHLDYRTVHYVKVALDEIFTGGVFVNEIIWCYSVGGKSRRGFAKKHDTILWYGRTENYAFHSADVRIPRKAGSHMRVRVGEDGEAFQEKTDRKTGRVYRYPVGLGKIPEDWWTDIETLNHSDKQRSGWPTQKPEKLLERLMIATTRPGDLVCDWFSGSGTTAVVAGKLGRRFWVVDAEPAAIDCVKKRLELLGTVAGFEGAPVDKPCDYMGQS